jgi:hypothetical protein
LLDNTQKVDLGSLHLEFFLDQPKRHILTQNFTNLLLFL